MFNSNNSRISVLLLTVILTAQVREARAGLFDWKPWQRKPVAEQTKVDADRPQAKSPKPSRITQASASEAAFVAAEDVPDAQPVEVVTDTSMPAVCDTDRPEPAMKMCCEKTFCCFNCGQDDQCQTCERHCRKKCHQTWYPRVAPYCQSGWGFTQPCWRRAQDCSYCPPAQFPSASPLPAPALEGPANEPLPPAAARPRESASRR